MPRVCFWPGVLIHLNNELCIELFNDPDSNAVRGPSRRLAKLWQALALRPRAVGVRLRQLRRRRRHRRQGPGGAGPAGQDAAEDQAAAKCLPGLPQV